MGVTLSIITLVLALAFIAVEAGLGALRGMKKELCRVGSLFAIGLLLFFLVPGIAKTIILASMKLIYPNSASFADVAGILAADMNMDASVGFMIETILALVASLLVPFVFVALFWVCKLISWPIFALVCMIIRNARKPLPEGNDGGAVTKQRKPDMTERLIGAAIGAVAGLFLGALTFMPLAQLSKSVAAVGKETVAEITDGETADIVCFWSESPAGTLYRVTQLEDLFGLLHNSLARVEIEDRVYEAKDLNEVLAIIPKVLELAEKLEYADASVFSEDFIDECADVIYEMNLAEALLPSAIDMAVKSVLSEMDVNFVPHEDIADFKSTKQDFKDLLKLAKELVELAEDAENGKLTTMSEVKATLNEVAKLKNSPFIAAETYANLETALIKNAVSNAKVEETVQSAVKEHIEEIKQNVGADVEIDDETIEKVQEAVSDYLANPEEINLEDVDNVITGLEDGTLMEGMDDPEVLEDIKNGNFNLSDWMSRLNGSGSN